MAPKWGLSASNFMWKIRQDRKFVMIFIGISLIVAGLGSFHNPVTWLVFGVLISCGSIVSYRILQYSREMYRAASETLGIEVKRGKGNAPPSDSIEYEQWCTEKGLEPYSAAIESRASNT